MRCQRDCSGGGFKASATMRAAACEGMMLLNVQVRIQTPLHLFYLISGSGRRCSYTGPHLLSPTGPSTSLQTEKIGKACCQGVGCIRSSLVALVGVIVSIFIFPFQFIFCQFRSIESSLSSPLRNESLCLVKHEGRKQEISQ